MNYLGIDKRNPHVKNLLKAGYSVRISKDSLFIDNIAYKNKNDEIRNDGIIHTRIEREESGDIKTIQTDHQIQFKGDQPYKEKGHIITTGNFSSMITNFHGVEFNFNLSYKIGDKDYPSIYSKIYTYVRIISTSILTRDPSYYLRQVNKNIELKEIKDIEKVFHYTDENSNRAGVYYLSNKLVMNNIAIIGLGGTGSHILDHLAKCPVKNIYLYDDDKLEEHNAFRSPGAVPKNKIKNITKVEYYKEVYSNIRENIHTINEKVTVENKENLKIMDYVFIAIDSPEDKHFIMDELEKNNIPYICTGITIRNENNRLRATTMITKKATTNSVANNNNRTGKHYESDIQISEINALNAIQAIIQWKKECGYYDGFRNYKSISYNSVRNDIKEK